MFWRRKQRHCDAAIAGKFGHCDSCAGHCDAGLGVDFSVLRHSDPGDRTREVIGSHIDLGTLSTSWFYLEHKMANGLSYRPIPGVGGFGVSLLVEKSIA